MSVGAYRKNSYQKRLLFSGCCKIGIVLEVQGRVRELYERGVSIKPFGSMKCYFFRCWGCCWVVMNIGLRGTE